MSAPKLTLPHKPSYQVRTQWAQELAIRGLEKAVQKRQLQEGGWQRQSSEHDAAPGGPLLGDIPTTPILGRTPSGKELKPPPSPPPSKGHGHKPTVEGPYTVAIVGAGAAGLFTGLIFDWLNKPEQAGSAGFHVGYEILESADTAGGRLFTYNFETGPNGHDGGKHLYYDVGAMRFPDNPIMQRTFDLFQYLEMKKAELHPSTPVGSLIPYYMKNTASSNPTVGREFFRFNDITQWGDISTINLTADLYDPFSMNYDKKIPSGVLANTPDAVMNQAIEYFRNELASGNPDAWNTLMDYDQISTRQYLLSGKYVPPSKAPGGKPGPPPIPDQPYNWETINWLETFNGGTSWYDQAHSETVLESMDFEYPVQTEDKGWWCILGGANVLAQKMQGKLVTKPKFNVRVTGIDAEDVMKMRVWSKPTTGLAPVTPKIYNGVFNSTSLGCMREMNVNAELNYPTKEAMRSLGYGPSAKVGILFKSAWWVHELDSFNIAKGGLGHSDLTIRTCVYPSYNYNVPIDTPAVLLCSYTWQQDAERIGSLMVGTNNPNLLSHEQIKDDEWNLRNLVIRDLAKMHTGNPGCKITEEELYVKLQNSYLDHYAHDWTHDPNTAGAFAFFRPAQFSTVWPDLIQPTNDLVIIGEAASPHHAWVVGALESAVHGVYSWIHMNRGNLPGAEEALKILSTPDPDHHIPFVGLPDYMPVSTAQWHGTIGALAREDYLRKKKEDKSRKGTAIRIQ